MEVLGQMTEDPKPKKKYVRQPIQGPLLQYILDAGRPVTRAEAASALQLENVQSVSRAFNRLKAAGVIRSRGRKGWEVVNKEEARFLLDRHPNASVPTSWHGGARPQRDKRLDYRIEDRPSGVTVGTLLEIVGRLQDGTRIVRTLPGGNSEEGIIYKLQEV